MPETMPLFPVPEPPADGTGPEPETPGDRLERELAAFLPAHQAGRAAVLAEEYAAAMIELHARRPGRMQG